MLCVKRERGVLSSGETFGQNQIPMKRRTHPMSEFLWKPTGRNVNRALKEINAFEWEGDYRAEAKNRLKELLEEKMDAELEQYLGRAKHERRGEDDLEDYQNGIWVGYMSPEEFQELYWSQISLKEAA
jgi:uncharacterized protein YhaN